MMNFFRLHQKNFVVLLSSVVIATVLLYFEVANAQGLVPCSGKECNACHVIELGNNVLFWLLGVLFAVFGIMAFAAGWGLMTSGGNQVELDKAKSKLTNAVIGIVVVLAGWLIVDSVMRGLLNGGDLSMYSGFGPWSQINCTAAGSYNPTPTP